jgi:hypothetical protein
MRALRQHFVRKFEDDLTSNLQVTKRAYSVALLVEQSGAKEMVR